MTAPLPQLIIGVTRAAVAGRSKGDMSLGQSEWNRHPVEGHHSSPPPESTACTVQ